MNITQTWDACRVRFNSIRSPSHKSFMVNKAIDTALGSLKHTDLSEIFNDLDGDQRLVEVWLEGMRPGATSDRTRGYCPYTKELNRWATVGTAEAFVVETLVERDAELKVCHHCPFYLDDEKLMQSISLGSLEAPSKLARLRAICT